MRCTDPNTTQEEMRTLVAPDVVRTMRATHGHGHREGSRTLTPDHFDRRNLIFGPQLTPPSPESPKICHCSLATTLVRSLASLCLGTAASDLISALFGPSLAALRSPSPAAETASSDTIWSGGCGMGGIQFG